MKLLVVLLCMMFHLSSYAQNHMIEFKADSFLLGQFSSSDSKYSGRKKNSESDQSGLIFINFARSVSSHIQVGVQGYYTNTDGNGYKSENISTLLGGIYNFTPDHFTKTYYVSLYAGLEWQHTYLDQSDNTHSEALVGKISFGRRIPLAFISDNFTYSPEFSLKSSNYTKSSDAEWSQEGVIKFLQFSVFF
jgi:hypothetical protein